MDQLFTSLLTQLPNLAVAVWCIYNYQQTIKGLLDQQNKLLDQLLQARGLKVEQPQSTELPGSKADNPI
jgi:hypothetical protein